VNATETPAAVGWLVGFPCVGGRVTASQSVFLASADDVAASRLVAGVCTPAKLSRYKRSCE
jgi:hypothetical protein